MYADEKPYYASLLEHIMTMFKTGEAPIIQKKLWKSFVSSKQRMKVATVERRSAYKRMACVPQFLR